MLPLEGIKVLDLGSVLMAPYAAQWLADLGADVIKVETPAGDSTRRTGPTPEPGMAAIFLGTNRNKRSIVLDLRDPAGLAALLRLVDGADVFLHNIRPQKLARLGIAPEVLMARNPRLVYAGLHGFGQDGPYGGQPAYDDIIQGMCGNADLMQRQIGQPKYFSTVSADKTSGLVAAIGILAALAGRERSGVGGFVEIPMFETMVAFNLVEHLYGAHFDPPLGPTGYPRALAVARGPFRTADGHISMMPYTDRHWIDLFREVGAEDMLVDPLFIDITARTSNIDLLYERLAAILLTRSSGEWLELCTRIEVPAAPVLKIDDLVHDAHLQETGFFEHLSDPRLGALLFPGVPLKFDGVRPGVRVPPRLGEHTREVLEEAGFTDDEIAALLAGGPDRQPAGAETRNAAAVAQSTL